jgi:hypothetical protein
VYQKINLKKTKKKLSKMNLKEKELLHAISRTEKFSGYDAMSYFDDMDNFDGDSMAYEGADGMEDAFNYAGGGNQAMQVSDPYVISYQNTTAGNVTAILFGYNDYFNVTNYGNPTAVVITNVQTGTTAGYGRMIAQSNNKFFKIGKWRFQSTVSSQLQVTLNIYHVDANGKQYITPLNLSIMRDAYQQQSDIIDVTKQVTVDGNTYVTFPLIASQTLTISMFPIEVISGKAKLNGGTSLNSAIAPRLSGKNVAPVIIQTSQNVKGITKG